MNYRCAKNNSRLRTESRSWGNCTHATVACLLSIYIRDVLNRDMKITPWPWHCLVLSKPTSKPQRFMYHSHWRLRMHLHVF